MFGLIVDKLPCGVSCSVVIEGREEVYIGLFLGFGVFGDFGILEEEFEDVNIWSMCHDYWV